MKKLVIFGLGELAELAYWYFSNQSGYEVEAFTAEEKYIKSSSFFNLPVWSYEEFKKMDLTDSYDVFIAIGYSKLNKPREQKFNELKKLGYTLTSFISPKANVLTDSIGENCFILEGNTVQPFCSIGDNVILWSGNHVGHHSKISENCFITSHVVISGGVTIGRNSFIGVNATLRDHIKIGNYNVIGASSIIMRDTEDYAVYSPTRTIAKGLKSSELKGF